MVREFRMRTERSFSARADTEASMRWFSGEEVFGASLDWQLCHCIWLAGSRPLFVGKLLDDLFWQTEMVRISVRLR